jgi:deoxyhypusine synthase
VQLGAAAVKAVADLVAGGDMKVVADLVAGGDMKVVVTTRSREV